MKTELRPETAPALRRWIPPIVALAIFALVLLVIDRELAGFHLRDVLAYLRQIPASSILAAAAATLASYLMLSVYDVLGLRYARKPLPYRAVLFKSVIAYAIGHSFGAAALTGGAVRYRLYSRAGLTGVDVATLQGFCSATTAVGLTILIGVSLIAAPQVAFAELHMSQPWPGIIGIALLAMIVAYVSWGSFTESGFEFRGWVLRPPGLTLSLLQVATGAIELSVSAAVLWSLLPIEVHVDFLSFLGIYALAVAAGIASYLPGGIGVFESVILVALPGAPPDHVLGALLGYRAIYYLLPLLLAGIGFAGFEISFQRPRLARIGAAAARVIAPIAPQLGGALIFFAGIVLLVSGATPGIDERLRVLKRVLPLPLVELSHLVGSVIGLGLLVLSRALFRRVREGYRLTVWLLAAGMVASILKGLDFEEASVLAVVLAVLWLGRSAFRRPASIVDDRMTPVWIVSIAGVLAAVVWVAVFAHRHVVYSSVPWWTFATSGDVPRALRASVIVVLGAGALFALDLLRPARPDPEVPDAADLERARRVVAASDTTLANAALTGDKRLLFAPDQGAFIMYQVAGRSWVALGDPVGNRGRGRGTRLAIPRARRPAWRMDRVLPGQQRAAAALHRPGVDADQDRRGGARAVAGFRPGGQRQGRSPPVASARDARWRHVRTAGAGQRRSARGPAGAAPHIGHLAPGKGHGREGIFGRQLRRSVPAPIPARGRAPRRRTGCIRQPVDGDTERVVGRPDALQPRRTAQRDGFPVRRIDALGPRARISLVRSRHGAAGGTRTASARAVLEPRGQLHLPLRRVLLQFRRPAALQVEVRTRMGAALPRLARRLDRVAAHPDGYFDADRRRGAGPAFPVTTRAPCKAAMLLLAALFCAPLCRAQSVEIPAVDDLPLIEVPVPGRPGAAPPMRASRRWS